MVFEGSVVHFLYAPEADVDVLIEMAASGGQSFGGIQPGDGGWGCFRMTLKKNTEYAIKLGSNEGELQPTGGGIPMIQYSYHRILVRFVEDMVVELQQFMRKINS